MKANINKKMEKWKNGKKMFLVNTNFLKNYGQEFFFKNSSLCIENLLESVVKVMLFGIMGNLEDYSYVSMNLSRAGSVLYFYIANTSYVLSHQICLCIRIIFIHRII